MTEYSYIKRFGKCPSYDYILTGKLNFGIDLYHAKRKNWNDTKVKRQKTKLVKS